MAAHKVGILDDLHKLAVTGGVGWTARLEVSSQIRPTFGQVAGHHRIEFVPVWEGVAR